MQRLRLRIRLLAPGRSSSLFSAARGGAADALSGAAAARGGAAAACGGAAAARGGAAAAVCGAEAARAWALLVAVVGVAGELNLGVNSIKPDSVFSRGLDPDPINLTRIHNPALKYLSPASSSQ